MLLKSISPRSILYKALGYECCALKLYLSNLFQRLWRRSRNGGTWAWELMKKPQLDPDVVDVAPTDSALTAYDEEHIITYLRLLDADAEGADWREVARLVLHIDPKLEPARAKSAFDSHLARAKWMTEQGYRHLLRGGASNSE
jgi:hypothetical protein